MEQDTVVVEEKEARNGPAVQSGQVDEPNKGIFEIKEDIKPGAARGAGRIELGTRTKCRVGACSGQLFATGSDRFWI